MNQRFRENSRYYQLKEARNRQRRERVTSVAFNLVKVIIVLVIAIGVPYLSYTGYVAINSSNYFRVKTINVLGTSVLDHDYVVGRGEINKGENILNVDTFKIEENLVSDPWIANVHVETELPDTINITITEYKPKALVVTGSDWQLVDSSGIPFKAFEPTDPINEILHLPYLTGPSPEELKDEDVRQLVVSAIKLSVLYQQMAISKLHTISEIHVDPVTGLTLVFLDGLRVQLGIDRFKERLERLEIILKTLKKEKKSPQYILADQEKNIDRVIVGSYMQVY